MMAGMSGCSGGADVSGNLKEALCDTLNHILSPQASVRRQGEEHIKLLEITEEFGVHLLELAIDEGVALAVRQLASVLLQQYVEAHWSSNASKFRAPECPASSKAKVREMLPLGLFVSSSKVRSSLAYAISSIGSWDWPEEWPSLFDVVMKAVQSGDAAGVHGAMRVLTEFSRDLDDFHIQQVAPVILPEMYNIFCQEQKYSIRTRGRAVEIFSSVAQVISMLGEYNKNVAKTLLYPSLPPFIQAMLKALQTPDGPTADSGLKKEILKALTVLVTNVPKQMVQYLPDILSYIWHTLTTSAVTYQNTNVNACEDSSDPTDSDGEVLGFESLVFSLFEFVTSLLRASKHKDMIKQGVPDLLYYLILYMQLTEEQVQIFTESVDSFVEFDDEESFTYSVRSCAQDLLKSLRIDLPQEYCAGLASAVQRHVQAANTAKNSGDSSWWKLYESILLAVGTSSDSLFGSDNSSSAFDVINFLQAIIKPSLDPNLPSFLVGRALWCSSNLARALDTQSLESLLQMCSTGLQADTHPIIKISVIRSLPGYFEVFNPNPTIDNNNKSSSAVNGVAHMPLDILKPYFSSIIEGLVLSTAQSSSEVMALSLETLFAVVSLDHDLTAPHIGRVSSLCLAVFIKSSNDPVLVAQVQELLQELCTHPAAATQLQSKFLPTLASLLNAAPDKVPPGIHTVALDMMSVLVRACPNPANDSLLMTNAFPAVINRTLGSDDLATQQSGGECLRAYVSVVTDKVVEWRDNDGRSGLDYIVEVCNQLLAPGSEDSAATFVGRLVTALIRKASRHLGDNLHMLLRGVLSKLQSSNNLAVAENLVLVFAHLIHTELEDLMSFLTSIPGPSGDSALNFVLTTWCSKQHLFFGSYERKVTVLALCKLLEHGIISDDVRLQNITVQGDQIISSESGVRTRYQAISRPDQWTQVPLLAKLFKLIIYELANVMEANMGKDDSQEGDEDDGWEDEECDGGTEDDAVYTSDLLKDNGCFGGDIVDDEEDPDALTDPLNNVELQPYLTNFIRTFAQHPAYSMFTMHLNPHEKEVLRSIAVAHS